MAPHQFFALIACVLCLGLSTIAVNQVADDTDAPPTLQTSEAVPAPPVAPTPIRL
jgi:hypothetical protein